MLAISYYSEWHGTPEALYINLNTMATTYPGYEIDIAETAYPASGGGGSPMPDSPSPRTTQVRRTPSSGFPGRERRG